MITIDKVTKSFGPTVALNNVSFEVQKGAILGFLGPNGAGKTTTMRIITGYFPPTDGNAYVAGYSVLDQPMEVKKRIGYVPEHPYLYRDMMVGEYIRFIGAIKGIPKQQLKERVDQSVERCALGSVYRKRIGEISRGYKQRVCLGQALVNNPPVMILDEPTTGLDPEQIYSIRQLIKSMAGERTIILSTHILPEVSMTCDKVVIINEGKVVATDTTENIGNTFSTTAQIEVRARGPQNEIIEALSKLDGISNVKNSGEVYTLDAQKEKDLRPVVAKTVVNNGYELLELKSRSMSLEDVYLRLVTVEEEVRH
ncbi:MAG: ATP-binding cassette domain-containing protein [Spirochaetota bacterium]